MLSVFCTYLYFFAFLAEEINKFLVHAELDFCNEMTNGLFSKRHTTEDPLSGNESHCTVIETCNLFIIILIIPFLLPHVK